MPRRPFGRGDGRRRNRGHGGSFGQPGRNSGDNATRARPSEPGASYRAAMSNGRLTHLSRSVAGARELDNGAASGMGRATAHLFADEGARVAVVDIGEERVQAVVDEIGRPRRAPPRGYRHRRRRPRRPPSSSSTAWSPSSAASTCWSTMPASRGVSSAFQDEESFEANWARTLDVNLTAHVPAHPPVPAVPPRGRRWGPGGQHRLDRGDRRQRRQRRPTPRPRPAWSA